MTCFFEKCSDAAEYAAVNKSFGAFYSDIRNQNRNLHIHDCCELFFCLSGGHTVLIDDRVYNVNDGDIFVINQFETHKVVPDKDGRFERYILHVHPAYLYSNSLDNVNLSQCFYGEKRSPRLTLSADEREELIRMFELLKKEKAFGDEMYKKLRVLDILLEVSRLFAIHGDRKQDELTHKTVQLAVDYINQHYDSDLGLEEIAKNSFVSSTHLSRLFKTYCGTTVGKYIISKRITEAKKMLSAGMSVTDTALSCGFGDYSNFIRTFKNATGVSPGKYKNSI